MRRTRSPPPTPTSSSPARRSSPTRPGARSRASGAGPPVSGRSSAPRSSPRSPTSIPATSPRTSPPAPSSATLLWVVLAANLIGMVVQTQSAKLGIATGKNLPELCRQDFPAQDLDRALDPGRAGGDGDRHRRGDRRRARPLPAVRDPAVLGGADRRRRLVRDPGDAAARRPQARGGDRRLPGDRDRRVRVRGHAVEPRPEGGSPRACSSPASTGPRAFCSPPASSAPRSCRTSSTCTRR